MGITVLCLFFVFLCIILCLFWFYDRLDVEERAGCFALIICLKSGSEALPHDVIGWSAVCCCGIS